MKKTFLILSLGMLTLSLSGCPSSSPPADQAAQPTPTPSPSPQASSSPPAFEQALQPGQASTQTPPKVAGLIPATNSDQQLDKVKQGRNDPFATLPVDPIVKYPPAASVVKKTTTTTASKPPSVIPIPPNSRPLPPQPNEALGVVVSGVMDLPSSPVAIVKAPGESVARRVTPGATLSNGQVLVKAIYAGNSNPMVILEQYGIEVTKRVGEGAALTPKAI
ncbi:hypothetical protein [Chroococcus sp. FPU101]|uniref:hypothetical protein n=1 Tax=Chroococcus sp. FPU101 TaxID=1974212 RepID=UPI001A8D362F|nr:hypothetical protein [Chroococcus sp. FPU101]GFE70284.1 hypothetical protein CFPU101_28940 [Chroococcus sp. FPU101]